MKNRLQGELIRALAVLVVLLGLKGAHALDWPALAHQYWFEKVITTLSNRGLNKEAREALTAGYYEGLLNEGSRLSTMNRFVLDTRRPNFENTDRPESRKTNDFLYYEHVPNLVTPDYKDHRFKYLLTTNSAGMGDKEYALVKPANTWRIALLGDSITRGLGAPPGGNYESLLEDKLNQTQSHGGTRHIEILNFAVSGYHITQELESERVKAAVYKPDLYLIALSDLSVYRRWHGHIAALVYSGIDLKYDFLRNMVREAQLTRDDPIGVFDARLAKYRLPAIRWVLSELKSDATAQHAGLMAILVPSTEQPETLNEAFLGVKEILAELGIPVIDLLDAFASTGDLERFRVDEGDRHPNAAGHRRLFEALYAELEQKPALMQALTGTGGDQVTLGRSQ
jgi:lysophospholipase L1-like esterase